MHLCILHCKYSHFHFKGLFTKNIPLASWSGRGGGGGFPWVNMECVHRQLRACQRAPELQGESRSLINPFSILL